MLNIWKVNRYFGCTMGLNNHGWTETQYGYLDASGKLVKGRVAINVDARVRRMLIWLIATQAITGSVSVHMDVQLEAGASGGSEGANG